MASRTEERCTDRWGTDAGEAHAAISVLVIENFGESDDGEFGRVIGPQVKDR